MTTIDVQLDGTLFSADLVTRAAHRYTGTHFVEVVANDQGHLVRLTAKVAEPDTASIAQQFKNDVLDERLRETVREQTGDLQATLLKAALREATPRAPLTQS